MNIITDKMEKIIEEVCDYYRKQHDKEMEVYRFKERVRKAMEELKLHRG